MSNVLALAQYAHTRIEPLFARVKAVEPSLQFAIEANFADEDSCLDKESSVRVFAYWARSGMFQLSDHLRSMADVDKFAAKVESDVAELEAEYHPF